MRPRPGTHSVWTVGHSTRTEGELLDLLTVNGIESLVDVRSYPGSRRHPQFDREAMAHWVPDAGIAYRHLPDLGGRRRRQDVDPHVNEAWRNASFHNYADWTLGHEFHAALGELEALASERRVAYMCSEALPWRCHRSLISTVLVARDWEVTHVMCDHNRVHRLGQWGPTPVVEQGRVTYPLAQGHFETPTHPANSRSTRSALRTSAGSSARMSPVERS